MLSTEPSDAGQVEDVGRGQVLNCAVRAVRAWPGRDLSSATPCLIHLSNVLMPSRGGEVGPDGSSEAADAARELLRGSVARGVHRYYFSTIRRLPWRDDSD